MDTQEQTPLTKEFMDNFLDEHKDAIDFISKNFHVYPNSVSFSHTKPPTLCDKIQMVAKEFLCFSVIYTTLSYIIPTPF
jgi:hypothetical protein